MSRRKVQAVVGLAMVSSLLLLSCAPAAAPTPQKAAAPPTTAPTAPPGVTPKPAAAPTATPRSAATVASTPAAAGGETPVYGGTLTVSLRDNPSTFDVQQAATSSVVTTVTGAYNTLLSWDSVDHNKMTPDLAKKWEVSPDGLVYTFYLEEGVKWHDGAPFSAEDVRYSLMREKEPPRGIYIYARGMLEPLQKVEAVNANTVKVTLSRPTASFPVMMTMGTNSILAKHVLEQKPDPRFDVVGTGPWKLKTFNSGVSIELVKNPAYFKKGLPYMNGRMAYIILDPTTRLSAFRTGRVLLDAMDHEPPAVDTIEATMRDVATAYRIPGVTTTANPFIGQTKPPFSDVRVRQAVNLALDRWEFVRVISPGFYGVGGYMSPTGAWALPEAEVNAQPGYAKTGPAKDAERELARKLLAEAGYPNGIDFDLETRAQNEFVNVAVWLKAQLEKAGLRGTLKPLESTIYYDHLQTSNFPIMSSSNGQDADDPDLVFSSAFVKGGGKNFGKYYDAEFDKLFVEQSSSVDPAKRKEIVRKMQLILHETIPYPVLGWRNRTLGVWKKVKGFTPWTTNIKSSAFGRHESTWLDPNLAPK
ncbi:MAG: ABC transporter substrate-binding protein [Chloroflexi bacterium]|nr:ABC transporter substrate-binding protein [Chloroflexota bacterium]